MRKPGPRVARWVVALASSLAWGQEAPAEGPDREMERLEEDLRKAREDLVEIPREEETETALGKVAGPRKRYLVRFLP